MRKKLLMGNWKMNKTPQEAKEFALASSEIVEFAKAHDILVGVCPTYVCLTAVKENCNPYLIVGAQNCHFEKSGAFTGEISIDMLKACGIDTVIIGHSERRQYDNETNEKCNKKIVELVHNDMVPVYCVGETLEQFEKGETKVVVEEQLRKGLANLCSKCITKVIIAYEPVWAIGTGKTATPEDAQAIHKFIRSYIAKLYNQKVADEVIIQYGGSMKASNAKELLSQPDIDGGLIGGASLKAETFVPICEL